jgi:hypothetical protein
MNLDNMNDIKAVLQLGRLGLEAMSSRMLSFSALLGILGIACYVVWRPDWFGVAIVGILSVLVFIPALRAESLRRRELKGADDDGK